MTNNQPIPAVGPPIPPDKQLLRKFEQAKLLGCHPRTVTRIAASDPTFPPEIELTSGMKVRSRTEIEAWLEAKRRTRAGDPLQPPPLIESEIVPIKRGRGRPRKSPKQFAETAAAKRFFR